MLDSVDGTDCRNYGGLDGIPEAKALLAGMVGCRPEQVIAVSYTHLPTAWAPRSMWRPW